MTERSVRRNEYGEALMNELARIWRGGERRVERGYVEEIGGRFDIDPKEARRIFVGFRGSMWEGELVESEGEPGWEAATLTDMPVAGSNMDSSV